MGRKITLRTSPAQANSRLLGLPIKEHNVKCQTKFR